MKLRGGYKNLIGLLKRWDLRTSIGIKREDVLLLSVGELNENKNHSIVIKALGEMRKMDWIHNFHYAIAGQGRLEKKLLNLAKESGIADRVHLLGFRSDIADWYRTADVFILPSFREGLSASLIEAMASGLLCIVSDIRGNRDLIANNHMRFLPENACEMIMILKDLTIQSILEEKRNNLKQIQRYSLSEVIEMMYQLYASLE